MGVIKEVYGLLQEELLKFEEFKIVFYISLVLSTLSPLIYYTYANKKIHKVKPLPAKLANNKERKFGHWVPEDFKFPTPKPYPYWNVNTTKPLPYRAFKHKYNVTMGITNMEYDDWIELDNEWTKFHDLKVQRIEARGEKVYGTLPEAFPAALELLHEFREYLPARYPSLFRKTTYGIDNILTGEKHYTLEPKEDPMVIVAKLIKDDVAVMIENEQGEYVLKAGCIVLPGFWRLVDKINKPLSEIHTSANVPKYDSNLRKGMEKFFTRLVPEKPVVRTNYSIQIDNGLAWSKTLGDEDDDNFDRHEGPPIKAKSIDEVFYRSERQSLRRLPISGAVIFTIGYYFMPLKDICDEPYVPKRLYDGLTSWTEDVRKYKGFVKFEDVVLPYLAEKAKEQEAMGYTEDKEVSNFPF